ncbi:TPA: cation-binding protein [Candidatus Woesearchaeota archaeon]|nr:cation-binding protein [Candidatus Woesearchaeota archaeon]
MKPYGPLMVEHRLIERMIKVVKDHVSAAKQEGKIDPKFIETMLHFFREYADQIHHGKEEDILFRDLAGKHMSEEHKNIMQRLIDEHQAARELMAELSQALVMYKEGEDVLTDIEDVLDKIDTLYPKHIEVEDKHFFIPVMQYFSEEELAKMTAESEAFDKRFDKTKYVKMVEELENEAKKAD